MRTDNSQFKAANESHAKSPRYVVAIIYDVASLYITSHDDIASVPGTVLQNCLKRPSAISQRVVPDEGRSEIGTFSFDIVDIASDFTDDVRAKLAAGDGLRGRQVRLYVGFKGFDFTAFTRFQTQIVSGVSYDAGVYTVTCEDITREQRVDVFDVKSTTLNATCTATDTTIQVVSTAAFLPVAHGSNWTDAPSSTVGYFKVDEEVVRYTGKSSTTFTGCTRGVFNTVAAAHTVDSTSPQERRPKVEEVTYLDMAAVKLALAMMTGVIVSPVAAPWPCSLLGADGGMQVDTNADGISDNWALFVAGIGDGARVQTATRPAGSSPFVGNVQRLAITSVGNSNQSVLYWQGTCRSGLTLTASAYIRTNVASKVFLIVAYLDAASATIATSLSSFVAGDSVAHLAQVTSTAPAGTEIVQVQVRGISAAGEFMEFDQVVLELGSTVNAYTGVGVQGLLPEHWHMGIQPENIRTADFTSIGSDLWKLTDDAGGFQTRFEAMTKQDGKRFLERELYLLLGAYSPIYNDGTLGLRRLPAMISDAAPLAVLTEREVVSTSGLNHDLSSLHNVIRVTWGYDIGIGDFTRVTTFIDAESAGIHGHAPPIDYVFRGLHSGIHTDVMIRARLDAIRDAYSYPPQRTNLVVLPSLNRFEIGDVMRVQVTGLRDFAGATTSIDRSFVILQRSIDFVTGELSFELFGSTLRPEALPPSTDVTNPLPDAYYTSQGVALSTLVSMTGNSVNAGIYTITGNADLTAAGAIVYHNGDLTIPSGATINISGNVQLRVKGFVTFNGAISGVGTGIAGVSDPGGAPLTSPLSGTPGFVGNSRGWDGVDVLSFSIAFMDLKTIAAGLTQGRYAAFPPLNLSVSGNVLNGLPTDLRGTGGPPGGRVTLFGGTATAGGTGAAGGAGLAIVCRGMSFGVSALINLTGANTNNPAVTPIVTNVGLYAGAGGAGGPGSFLIVLDGNNLQFPNAAGRFISKSGTVTQAGVAIPTREFKWRAREIAVNPDLLPLSGYQDEQLITDLDSSLAALRIQYVPSTQVASPNQDQLPAPITALTVTPGAGFNTLRATLPPANTFDLLEYYAAITNDRTGAVLIARGRISEFQHDLPVLATRYYWARTTRLNARAQELHSDWYPVSSTGGVSGTTLNAGGWTPITTAAGGATMIVTASTIEKSGGSSAWDSQVYSAERYTSCALSWRCADAVHDLMLALNTDPATDAGYASLDYAWECENTGGLHIYESGVIQSFSGTTTYDATTVLSITYDGEYVRYYRDGVLARSVVAVDQAFYLDSSFYWPGSKALDVKFTPGPRVSNSFNFTARTSARYVGRTIYKVLGSAVAYDSDCYAIEAFARGVSMSILPSQTAFPIMVGLSADPVTIQSYTGIDYAWHGNVSAGLVQIYESGSLISSHGSYTAATVLAINYDGEVLRYLKDGVVVREVTVVGRTLSFDSSLYDPGSYFTVLTYAGQAATTDVNAFVARGNNRYAGGTIEKVGGSNAWDSDCYSLDSYNACFVSFQMADTSHDGMVGLNTDPQLDQNFTSIDFAWECAGGGALYIYESSVLIGSFGSYTTSTVLSIVYDGQFVRYIKDGVVARETIALGRSFYFDSSLYFPGTKIVNVQFGPSGKVAPTASNLAGRNSCVVAGDTLEKVGGVNSWDSDVYSLEGYTEGAFCTARPSFTTKYLMFGLNSDPTTDQSYTSLDYAWYIRGDGVVHIYESGSPVMIFGSYTTADVFAVRHVGRLVQYIWNGAIVRSVTRVATTALFFDSSFSDPGGRLEGVRFGPAGLGAEADPSAVYLETFEGPFQTTFSDVGSASNVVVTYPNNGQFGGKVISAQRELWIQSNENLPFDANALYRISARIRRTASGGGSNEFVYVGVAGVAADGTTLINESGSNSTGGQHYNCARGFDMSAIAVNTWKDFTGWFQGTGTSGFGIAPNNDSPTKLYTGVKFIRPLLILNYNTGSGTMECDFIKVERLTNPDDADNTAKNRLVPDAEFALATDSTYWDQYGVTSIAITGGNVAGYAELNYNSVNDTSAIYSVPQFSQQSVRGEVYSISCRIRRKPASPTPQGFFYAGIQRLNNPVYSLASTRAGAYGGILIATSDIPTSWTEYTGLCWIGGNVSDAQVPFICAAASYNTYTIGGKTAGSVQVDYLNFSKGDGVSSYVQRFTASTVLQSWDPAGWGVIVGPYALTMGHIKYDSASPGTLTLPSFYNPQDVGMKLLFEQVNTGALTIGVGVMGSRTPPGSSAARTMLGQYAKAVFTADVDGTWHGVGQFA